MPENISEVQKLQGVVDVNRLHRVQQPLRQNRINDFAEVLRKEVQKTGAELRFSAHAQERLRSRSISLTSEDSLRLKGAVDRVAEKGGRESLVLMDNLAFVVSISNRTVITAVDGLNLRDNVFTNIDSAIMV